MFIWVDCLFSEDEWDCFLMLLAGHMVQGPLVVNNTVRPTLQHKTSEHKISTPVPKVTSVNKRKLDRKLPPAQKKSRVQSPSGGEGISNLV